MTAAVPQHEVPDMFTALASLPRPADLSGYRRERLETYLAALEEASNNPTFTTLRAASLAAFELHLGYSFYGWTTYGCAVDERGLVLMRQANALQDAAAPLRTDT